MPDHTIKQGEHLPRIAHDYGFSDYRVLWDRPQNAELKEKRENPHLLMPGDVVNIPDKESKEELCATDQHHRFRVKGERLMLRLRLLDCGHQPLANTTCELHVRGTAHQLTTDENGLVEQEVPALAESGILVFRDPLVPFEVAIPIKIGHLDPIDEPSGQKGRLRNLGYNPGSPKEHDEERFRVAVQEFQCDHGLQVTGDLDSVTRDKLKEVHGC
jgi:hypothetical protein